MSQSIHLPLTALKIVDRSRLQRKSFFDRIRMYSKDIEAEFNTEVNPARSILSGANEDVGKLRFPQISQFTLKNRLLDTITKRRKSNSGTSKHSDRFSNQIRNIIGGIKRLSYCEKRLKSSAPPRSVINRKKVCSISHNSC